MNPRKSTTKSSNDALFDDVLARLLQIHPETVTDRRQRERRARRAQRSTRLLVCVIAGAVALSLLAGCGSKVERTSTTTNPVTATTPTTTTATTVEPSTTTASTTTASTTITRSTTTTGAVTTTTEATTTSASSGEAAPTTDSTNVNSTKTPPVTASPTTKPSTSINGYPVLRPAVGAVSAWYPATASSIGEAWTSTGPSWYGNNAALYISGGDLLVVALYDGLWKATWYRNVASHELVNNGSKYRLSINCPNGGGLESTFGTFTSADLHPAKQTWAAARENNICNG